MRKSRFSDEQILAILKHGKQKVLLVAGFGAFPGPAYPRSLLPPAEHACQTVNHRRDGTIFLNGLSPRRWLRRFEKERRIALPGNVRVVCMPSSSGAYAKSLAEKGSCEWRRSRR